MLIFPAIDIINGQCVRLTQGNYETRTVYSNNPLDVALRWQEQGGTWLHVVDLDGAKRGEVVNGELMKRIVAITGLNVQVGGGIRNIATVRSWLDSGVSRVILGTVAVTNPQMVEDVIEQFGPERVVVGVDAKGSNVATKGWLETSGRQVKEVVDDLTRRGARTFIYTDISRDGMMGEPNFEAIQQLVSYYGECEFILAGGVSTLGHVNKAREAGLEGVNIG